MCYCCTTMRIEYGRYTLIRRLAVGGMAELFLAELHGDGGFAKTLVVKRILPHLSSDPDFIKMFIDEALIAARLTHPNVVAVHDFGTLQGSYYMAMEYVPGVDLHRLLRRAAAVQRQLTAAEVATLGADAARGLAYAHSLTDDAGQPLELVHRDISPQNLMLSVSDGVKLMDFGIAKAAARCTRTATGVLKGKLAYMAPEQAAGADADQRADQFSLGVVLWEALVGERLFRGDQEAQLMRRVMACDIPNVRSRRPDVPVALERILSRALAADPNARYPDVAALEAELTAFRFSLGAAGNVHLGDLVRELNTDAEAAEVVDWSWRHGPAEAPLAGTRRLVPASATTPATPATPPRRRSPPSRRSLGPAPRQIPAAASWEPGPQGSSALARRCSSALALAVLTLGLSYPWLWPETQAVPSGPPELAHLQLPPAPAPQHGRLSLRTDGPELEVYLGEQRLGATPLADEEVPAGRLELRLVNERAGISRPHTIDVPAGGSTIDVVPDE